MANPQGENNVIGSIVTCSDLLNSATLQSPAAVGSGLPNPFSSSAVLLTAAATSATYEVPLGTTLVVLWQLASGTATCYLNTGATTGTSMSQVASTGSNSGTNVTALFYQTPVAASTSGNATAGNPTSPYFNVSFATSGCQIAGLAVLMLGYFPPGADWVNVRSGINACASAVINSNDTGTSALLGSGSGAFSLAPNSGVV